MESIRYYIDGVEHVLTGGESRVVGSFGVKQPQIEADKYDGLMDKLEEVEEGLSRLVRLANEYCRYLDEDDDDCDTARELEYAYVSIKDVNTMLASDDWNIQDLLHNL